MVSAKTAATIFGWLRKRGTAAGQPLASCRLLLAPIAEEMADLTELSYGQPCFSDIRTALEEWRDDLFASARAGTPPVAFFFFSGHGMEHLSRPSLLAQDILAQDVADPGGKAVALNSMLEAVRTYRVKRGLFFIDACRNAPDIAKRLNIVGRDVLTPDPNTVSGPEALVWLQATRMGDFAYQPTGASASLFGQALIEALEGLPPDHSPYDRESQPWKLLFGGLERFVKRRTQDLLSARSATQIQVVEPGGNPYDSDLVVAEKEPPARVRTTDAKPPGLSLGLVTIGRGFSGAMPRRQEPSSSQRAAAMQQRFW